MKKLFIVITYTFYCLLAQSQSLYYPAKINSLITARYDEKVNSALVSSFNPAMLPHIHMLETGLFIEKRYLTTDIDHFVFAVSAFHNNNGGSVMFRQFGIMDYRERSFGIGYGKRLGRMQVGVVMNHVSVNVSGSPASTFLEAGMSSIFKISEDVTAGVQLSNPGFLNVGRKNRVRIASFHSLGIAWNVSREVYAAVESVKREERPPGIFLTLYYFFSEKYYAGLNWSTETNQPYVFTMSKWNHISLQAGCSYHQWLGISPAISITYSMNRKS